MTCYYNWNTCDFRRPNIDMMMRMADTEGASGVFPRRATVHLDLRPAGSLRLGIHC